MIFKVDFEKAFDSVRWDYLDDVLNNSTSEFKFFKGLKQGDPLSHFLFILIMESLHLSFKNVLDADNSNLSSIVNVLKCIFLASGLKINLHKSKLMGIGIAQDVVNMAANQIGCLTLSAPFTYLGVKARGSMSRITSWDVVFAKFFFWLSKWKLKTLSIGGRFTLIKYVLSPFPLYQMSIYKVPMGVLHKLELIRRNFFNVGNGDNTSFWNDVWLVEVPLKLLFLRLYALELDRHSSVAVKLRDRSLNMSFRRTPRGGIEEEQLQLLRDSTFTILLPNINDRWIWMLESLGDYSVKSARSFIDDLLLPSVGVPTRWVNIVPIKINIFSWRVCLDKLPTRLNLSHRGIDIPSIICPNCSIVVESTSHLFFSCHLAHQIMLKVARWWDLDVHDFHSQPQHVMSYLLAELNTIASLDGHQRFITISYGDYCTIQNNGLSKKHNKLLVRCEKCWHWKCVIVPPSFNSEITQSLTQPQQVDSQKKGGRKKNKIKKGVQNVEAEPQEPVAAGRWLPVEEEFLATCYVAVLEDNNVRRSQKHETFWYRVLNKFNSRIFQKRTKDMLTSKWHTLNANCQKFNAAYNRAKRLGKSSKKDVDLMKRAQSIYRDEHKGVLFSQEDAWAILKFHPKWDAPEQVDLTGDVSGLPKRIYSVTMHDHRVNPVRVVNGAGASSEREAAERAFEAQAEKDRTLMRLEVLRFLATSTKDLDDDDAYWIKKQKRLIKNKMRNDLGDEDDEDE
nr:RNA-directed DNA polymerase, eukaryota [Tanacetum cinerariifolium]